MKDLEEERVKTVETHLATLGSAEERIKEQREMISSYAVRIGDVTQELREAQEKAQAAARAATRQQEELTQKHREHEAALSQQLQDLERAYRNKLQEAKTQLERAQEQLKTAEAAKVTAEGIADKIHQERLTAISNCNSERRRFSDLCRDRLRDADDLLRTACQIAELMPILDMEHPRPPILTSSASASSTLAWRRNSTRWCPG